MAAKLLWGSLALTPVALAAHYLFGAGDTLVFVLAAAALVPLAWLIGEATEHVAEHTGPGIGGFVNASFGNAPGADHRALRDRRRAAERGSRLDRRLGRLEPPARARRGDDRGGDGEIDRRSTALQLGILIVAVSLFLVPSIPGWHGNPERHGLYLATIPVAVCLLALYVAITIVNLRRQSAAHSAPPARGAWTLRNGLLALAGATVATAFISALLVHTLDAFGQALGLSQFFVAVVIVAIVGNAAEHGGAIVVAMRGNMRLASEIAISSSAQVAVFVTPAIALLSFLAGPALPLAFRPVELVTMGVAAVAVAAASVTGRSKRGRGLALVGVYVLIAVWYGFAGDR